ncbi:hypothetical protein FQZ97_1275590 [compost metagenome]
MGPSTVSTETLPAASKVPGDSRARQRSLRSRRRIMGASRYAVFTYSIVEALFRVFEVWISLVVGLVLQG